MPYGVSYERIKYSDPSFPVTFHPDKLTQKRNVGFYLHWHEHLEIIFVTRGECTVSIDNNRCDAKKGDVVVINSNSLHSMLSKPFNTTYHCLILDKQFCDRSLIPISELLFNPLISDKRLNDIFLLIEREMREKQSFYKATVNATVVNLLALIARDYSTKQPASQAKRNVDSKQRLIKESINYISSRFYSELTIDEIAKQVGLSKYYFCRAFKEVTGQTAFDFINQLRCSNAQRLLSTGRYNISESAFESGFNNLSYFAKAYKKHMGLLPSEDLSQLLNKK